MTALIALWVTLAAVAPFAVPYATFRTVARQRPTWQAGGPNDVRSHRRIDYWPPERAAAGGW